MTSCGISNLGSCLVEKFFEFVIYILNLPVKPLLAMINNLMIEPVNVQIFAGVWSVVIYILSLFYGILLIFSGFRFLVSGHSAEQRDKAKRSLMNIIIMMILIQISFFLYSLILDLVASMTAVVFRMIPSVFFLADTSSLSNIGLELVLIIPYILMLVVTVLLLVIRYLCVSIGVIFCAFGIFFYFIEPLQDYGRLILNYLGVLISLPFFYSIILLASSKFLEVGTFSEMKIVVMIGGFALVNIFTILLFLFVVIKAANSVRKPIVQIKSLTGCD